MGSGNVAGGRKDDVGKLRFDLIPAHALEELARVYTIGAAKYADRNWEKGLAFGRVFAAMMRHAWAWWRGERSDPVDGQHHLSSVAWCAFALMEFERTRPGFDDRPGSGTDPDPDPDPGTKEKSATPLDKAGSEGLGTVSINAAAHLATEE